MTDRTLRNVKQLEEERFKIQEEFERNRAQAFKLLSNEQLKDILRLLWEKGSDYIFMDLGMELKRRLSPEEFDEFLQQLENKK